MVDRVLAGLRDQGPGAIPALILSLLALGGTIFWLVSRDDGRPADTVEVLGAPAPLTTTIAAPRAPGDRGSGVGSGVGAEERPTDGMDQGSGPAPVPASPVPPAPTTPSAGADIAPPAAPAAMANGDERPRGNEPPTLDDVQRLLRGGDRTAKGDDDTLLQTVRNLLLR